MHLAEHFAACGQKPIVICLRDRGGFGEQLARQGVPVVPVRSERGWDMAGIWRLAKILRHARPDVINVHDCSSLPYSVLANRLAGNCPVVMTCHGLLFHQRGRARLIERLAVRAVSAITAVSEKVAREYRERLGISRRIEIVENGVPVRGRRTDHRADVRHELGIADDMFVFLAVGNVKLEKGYEDLVEACHRLGREAAGKPFCVIVAGGIEDDGHMASLRARAGQLNVESTVRFLGYREDILALYSAVDAFVLSSRTEGLPMVLLEAMSTGLPVVATAVGGVPKVIAHSDVGVLVDAEDSASLADGMWRLLSSPELCASVGREGAALIEKRYSIGKMGREYMAVFGRRARALAVGPGEKG